MTPVQTKIEEIRKPKYVNPERSIIDVQALHPELGWIPMSLNKEEYPDLWDRALALGPVSSEQAEAEWVENNLAMARMSKSTPRANFVIGLRNFGLIDQAWAGPAAAGQWPQMLQIALAAGGNSTSAEDASIIWAGMATVPRTHPFVEAFRVAANITPVQMDGLFT